MVVVLGLNCPWQMADMTIKGVVKYIKNILINTGNPWLVAGLGQQFRCVCLFSFN